MFHVFSVKPFLDHFPRLLNFLLRMCSGYHHQKLIASHACNQTFRQTFLKRLCRENQRLVTFMVPIDIIDALKVIQINAEHRQMTILLFVDKLIHIPSVKQTCEEVRIRVLNHHLLIEPFLRHINRHTYGSHYAAIQIIQRWFVSCKQPHALTSLHGFFGNKGLFCTHNLPFRFDTCRIVLLNIPYVSMSTTFYLFLRFIYRFAETIIYLLMNTVFILVPNKIGNIINSGIQIMTGLPKIFTHFIRLLPSQKTESKLLFWHW